MFTRSPLRAADPTSATITLSSTPIGWQGTALGGGGVNDVGIGFVGGEDLCVEGVSCDNFTLTIGGSPADWINAGKMVHVHLEWTVPVQDFDLYIHKGDLNGPVVASSGNGATNGILTSEDTDLDPKRPAVGTGTFAVHVVYYTATLADQYRATARVVDAPVTPPPPPPPPPPGAEPAGTARFYNYIAPPGLGDDSGEPSIGVNGRSEKTFSGVPNGGTVNYFGGFLPYMLRVTFNDGVWPAKATWETPPLTVATAPRVAGDPILFTDRVTGRTFVTQEIGL
ncbi:MAG TPA: hypothetical protein VFW45_09570, partial [Candidatus Polarisedimenticolia bacterium]|nr:hypothetical protein [Candidatus Polarisedimenticolia bacterium]